MKMTLLLAALFITSFSLLAQEPKTAKLTAKQILEQVATTNQQTRGNFRLVLDSITNTIPQPSSKPIILLLQASMKMEMSATLTSMAPKAKSLSTTILPSL